MPAPKLNDRILVEAGEGRITGFDLLQGDVLYTVSGTIARVLYTDLVWREAVGAWVINPESEA